MGSIVARCATAQRTLVDINDDLCGSRNFRPWIWPLLVDDIRVFRRISSPEFKDQADAFNFLSGALRVMTHDIGHENPGCAGPTASGRNIDYNF